MNMGTKFGKFPMLYWASLVLSLKNAKIYRLRGLAENLLNSDFLTHETITLSFHIINSD